MSNKNNINVYCNNVYINKSTVCDGFGAFAGCDFLQGDTIEYGLAKVLTNCNGHENPVLFTWSDDIPNKTWASTSGCASYYNTSSQPNCKIIRDFTNNTFTIIATRDIQAEEELFHTYKSLQWRECFSDIRHV